MAIEKAPRQTWSFASKYTARLRRKLPGTWHGGWLIPWRRFNRWNSWYFRVLTLQFLWMVQVSRLAIISRGQRDLWMLAWACR
jgi:hypothetical protein